MLVFSRRVNESIVLPEYDTTITVLGIGGGRARIGVHAPQYIEIHCQEVCNRNLSEAAMMVSAGYTSVPRPPN